MNIRLIHVAIASAFLAGCGNDLSESKAEKMLQDVIDKKVSYFSNYRGVRVTKTAHIEQFDAWTVDMVYTINDGREKRDSRTFTFNGETWCMKGLGNPCMFEFANDGSFIQKN